MSLSGWISYAYALAFGKKIGEEEKALQDSVQHAATLTRNAPIATCRKVCAVREQKENNADVGYKQQIAVK